MTRRTVFCLALVVVLQSTDAPACSCGRRPTIMEAFAEALAVRLVTVVKVKDRLWWGRRIWYRVSQPEYADAADYVSRAGFEVTANVNTTFKGAAASQVRFLTGRGGGDCGVPFKEGAQYLLYLGSYETGGLSIVGMCNRGGPAEEVSEDLVFLQGHP